MVRYQQTRRAYRTGYQPGNGNILTTGADRAHRGQKYKAGHSARAQRMQADLIIDIREPCRNNGNETTEQKLPEQPGDLRKIPQDKPTPEIEDHRGRQGNDPLLLRIQKNITDEFQPPAQKYRDQRQKTQVHEHGGGQVDLCPQRVARKEEGVNKQQETGYINRKQYRMENIGYQMSAGANRDRLGRNCPLFCLRISRYCSFRHTIGLI